jgi:phosphoribosylformylglycinamidine synthase
MPHPRVLVLRAPGSNCDIETAHAFERVGGRADRLHVNRLLEKPELLGDYQILCIPGGFSYGDDIAAGKVFAERLRNHLYEPMSKFREADKLILGICNGFQVLIKTGLLFPDLAGAADATLTWNDTGRYESHWVNLEVESRNCVFLRGLDHLYLPVAHAEGKFVFRSEAEQRQLSSQHQIALRYVGRSGEAAAGYPWNPNGSQLNVAGICDPTGRVFGLMPHPERHIDPTHHPRWTREGLQPEGDGLAIFRNAVAYFG